MRIIIEFDSSTSPEIKTIGAGDDQQIAAVSSQPIDAGSAYFPEQELVNQAETLLQGQTSGNEMTGINAGEFNANLQGGADESHGMPSHENELFMATLSGSAMDAGMAKQLGEEQMVVAHELFTNETRMGDFDRSNAISAGEFIPVNPVSPIEPG